MSYFARAGLALAVSTILIPSISMAQSAAGKPKTVFACSLGAKQVQVTSVGSNLLYQFGTVSKPEMVIVGNPKVGNVSYHSELYPHSVTKQLRFRNGAYSYIPYYRWASAGYDGTGAENRSGLLVQRGGKTIANLKCKTARDFGESYDLKSLPDDDDLIEL